MASENIKKEDFTRCLTEIFSINGLSSLLSSEKAEKFFSLTNILIAENEKYNLTAITEPKKIILNHFADCAALANRLANDITLCDVGCGAGFPSLPVAILRPDISVLGIDATAKRTAYVRFCAEELGLRNIEVLTGRAEEIGQDSKYREKFDTVTARAVANMRVLSELCLPLCKVGGEFIAMKGKNAEGELAEARRAIPILMGKLSKVENITLSSSDEEITHPLIVVKKIGNTPASYPRPYAKILKKPL